MAQRKSPSYPEWPVDRSVYSLFCGVARFKWVKPKKKHMEIVMKENNKNKNNNKRMLWKARW